MDEAADMRSRNKQATRDAIGAAALRLAVEQGPGGLALVRVNDIAAAAGVSPRTYNNYFSSREEAICSLRLERAKEMGAALAARPPDEPLDQAIINAMITIHRGAQPEKETLRLILHSPTLRAEFLKNLAEVERPLIVAIAQRTGADPDRELFPRLLATVIFSAIRAATEQWLRPETTEPLGSLVAQALTYVAPAAAAYEREMSVR
jgi:AcrR family transcriptional regulator